MLQVLLLLCVYGFTAAGYAAQPAMLPGSAHHNTAIDHLPMFDTLDSALTQSPTLLIYHAGSFWTFVDHQVFRIRADHSRELIFQLAPSSKIQRIGASPGHLWAVDNHAFYGYQLATGKLTGFTLPSLSQVDATPVVYDALRSGTTWIVTTDSGGYFSTVDGFQALSELSVPHRAAFDLPANLMQAALIGGLLFCVALVIAGGIWRAKLAQQQAGQVQCNMAIAKLRQQNRLLFSSNHLLRKQLHVRALTLSRALQVLKQRLQRQMGRAPAPTDPQLSNQQLIRELDVFAEGGELPSATQATMNLDLVVQSALDAWQAEFRRYQISVVFARPAEMPLLVQVADFTLDIVINALLNNVLRRGYRTQQVRLSLELCGDDARLTCVDQGRAISRAKRHPGDWYELNQLVLQSGGRLALFGDSGHNTLELRWPHASVNQEFELTLLEPPQPWLLRLEALVQEQFSNPEFSTTTAAKLMFVSERSLQRRFKQLTGRTFKDYLNEIRFEHARFQLVSGRKVSDVAYACGFNDASYFSQRFKAYFGASPTQFVERQEQQDALVG